MADNNQADLTKLTVELLSAYLANNKIESGDLPSLIASTRASLSSTPSDSRARFQAVRRLLQAAWDRAALSHN
jgi:predicted transcriptional regulator